MLCYLIMYTSLVLSCTILKAKKNLCFYINNLQLYTLEMKWYLKLCIRYWYLLHGAWAIYTLEIKNSYVHYLKMGKATHSYIKLVNNPQYIPYLDNLYLFIILFLLNINKRVYCLCSCHKQKPRSLSQKFLPSLCRSEWVPRTFIPLL